MQICYERTVDLMKKGLRPISGKKEEGTESGERTVDLMKKGLRLDMLEPAIDVLLHGTNRRPDEEGIETPTRG